MHGYQITCGACGQSSSTALWMETPMGKPLPIGHFQCPKCRTAIKREFAESTVFEVDGGQLLIPGKCALVAVAPLY